MNRRTFLGSLLALPAALVAVPQVVAEVAASPASLPAVATFGTDPQLYKLIPYGLAITMQHELIKYEWEDVGLAYSGRLDAVERRLEETGYSRSQVERLIDRWERSSRRAT